MRVIYENSRNIKQAKNFAYKETRPFGLRIARNGNKDKRLLVYKFLEYEVTALKEACHIYQQMYMKMFVYI